MLEVENTGPVLEPDVGRRAASSRSGGPVPTAPPNDGGRRPRAFDRERHRRRPPRHHDPEGTPRRRPPCAGATPRRPVTPPLAPAIAICSQPATPNHPISTGLTTAHDLAEPPKRPGWACPGLTDIHQVGGDPRKGCPQWRRWQRSSRVREGRSRPEFKAEVVELVRQPGNTAGSVARDLNLTETAVRSWAKQADLDAGRAVQTA